MSTRTCGIIAWLAIFAFFSAGASAQSDGATRKEFWPEIDVFIKLNAKFRIFLLGTVSRARENSSLLGEPPFDGQVGAHLDYIANKHVSLRIGYRYDTSLNGADPSKEHRLLTEQTFRKMLPARLLLSDRNRQDFRWINGDYSFRYRNRVTLEREFAIRERAITPYASGELFYDTRFNTWNRNRYAFGIQISLKRGLLNALLPERQIVLDIYFMRQNDSRSSTRHVNAIGLAWSIYL